MSLFHPKQRKDYIIQYDKLEGMRVELESRITFTNQIKNSVRR